MKIKVGMMPGRLTEVEVVEGLTAREIFGKANVEVSNHEVRLDGEKIEMDTIIERGALLVAMKMIKGNSNTIKVGMMPGRLEVVEVEGTETAREIFEKANIEVSNHEIRLDGEKVDIDTVVGYGNLLVAMKMIKGNASVEYVTDFTQDEVEMLLGVRLPREIDAQNVETIGENLIQIELDDEFVVVEGDMFVSVYELIAHEVQSISEIDIKEVETKNPIQIINGEIKELENVYDYYIRQATETRNKISVLEDILVKINN